MDETSSGTIAFTIVPQAKGRYACELTTSPPIGVRTRRRFHGQTAKHALANALESLALALRLKVEAEQAVDWDAVDRSPSGEGEDKRFHVILHYERLLDEESKFDALHNTLLGNTVVENAETTIIQVDPHFPALAWKSRLET
jgi:hypothetical protein